MSTDDIHIARPDSPKRHGVEVLCGFQIPAGGNRVAGPPSMATCWRCILLQCGRPIPPEPPIPEHERLKIAKKTDDATTLVGEFFDWLTNIKGYTLGVYDDDSNELMPVRESVHRLLAEFFGIDQNALEREKQTMLEHVRAINKARDWALDEGRATLADK